MKKQLLALLCLAVLSIGTTAEARRWRRGGACGPEGCGPVRGGGCGPCAPCGAEVCPDQCPVEATCPQGVCVNPPGAPCFESCVRKECVVEQVPVQFFRNVKKCNIEVPGPVYSVCPDTDRVVATAETDLMIPEARMVDVPARQKVGRRMRARANRVDRMNKVETE